MLPNTGQAFDAYIQIGRLIEIQSASHWATTELQRCQEDLRRLHKAGIVIFQSCDRMVVDAYRSAVLYFDKLEVRLAEEYARLGEGLHVLLYQAMMSSTQAAPAVSNRRRGLHMIFRSKARMYKMMAGFDTGTRDNHMSLQLATEMGLVVRTDEQSKGWFELGNGNRIRSEGRTTVRLQFAEGHRTANPIIVVFNVFSEWVVPPQLGTLFLRATETLTKYTDRLVPWAYPEEPVPRLCAVGGSVNMLSCSINGCPTLANADTGSDLNLMSPEYAAEKGFHVVPNTELLLFPNGATESTTGYADVKLSVGTGYNTETCLTRFHILPNLAYNVLVSDSTLNLFDIFRTYTASIAWAIKRMFNAIAKIIHLTTGELLFRQAQQRCRAWFIRAVDPRSNDNQSNGAARIDHLLQQLNDLNQAENRERDRYCRDLVSHDFSNPPDPSKQREEIERQDEYRRVRQKLLHEIERMRTLRANTVSA